MLIDFGTMFFLLKVYTELLNNAYADKLRCSSVETLSLKVMTKEKNLKNVAKQKFHFNFLVTCSISRVISKSKISQQFTKNMDYRARCSIIQVMLALLFYLYY